MMQPLVDTRRVAQGQEGVARPVSLPVRVARNMALQDWVLVLYFGFMLLALLCSSSPDRRAAFETVIVDLGVLVAAMTLVRGELLREGSWLSGMVYRAGIFAPVFLSYFQLRDILPAVTTQTLDAEIYAFDMRVFHYEPSVAWDRFVTPATTEWFAFFYFLYFFILSVHVLPFLLFAKDTRLFRHFALGIFLVFCTAHLLYMAVPGFGPYKWMHFEHELEGGFFWRAVLDTVHAGGAFKDIFPSLHTAAPTYLTLFSFVHRDKAPFKYTWPVMAFVVSQIVIATMFLRWHYLVDIVAGLILAATAVLISRRLVQVEWAWREGTGLPHVFGPAPLRPLLPRRFL